MAAVMEHIGVLLRRCRSCRGGQCLTKRCEQEECELDKGHDAVVPLRVRGWGQMDGRGGSSGRRYFLV